MSDRPTLAETRARLKHIIDSARLTPSEAAFAERMAAETAPPKEPARE